MTGLNSVRENCGCPLVNGLSFINGAGTAVLIADFQAFTTLDVSDFQFV